MMRYCLLGGSEISGRERKLRKLLLLRNALVLHRLLNRWNGVGDLD
jgi:hypothetical protein